ncbi:MAG: hypothetical protein KDD91_07730, partial [Caldilinea sp.]|nr:hypothetical protein [Caldilinea sp.]
VEVAERRHRFCVSAAFLANLRNQFFHPLLRAPFAPLCLCGPLLFLLPDKQKTGSSVWMAGFGFVAEPEQAQITRRCGPDPASCSSY